MSFDKSIHSDSMKPKILFMSAPPPFIRQDREVLKLRYEVKAFDLIAYDSRLTALIFYARTVWWLLKNIWTCDALFIRFADVYAFFFAIFAKIFRKKLFIVVGGFEATWIPEWGYGTYHNKRSRFFTRYSLQTATKILPVSKSLVASPKNGFGLKHRIEGIKLLYPEVDAAKIHVIPNGYRTEFFCPDPTTKKIPGVLTVASIRNKKDFILKGIDVFIDIARQKPALPFTIVGAKDSDLRQWAGPLPENLRLVNKLNHEALLKEYQAAKVFMCLSLTGGMPNVLSEAMLCECVPVGYDVSAIPEIIGDTGIIIQQRDSMEILSGVEQALLLNGKRARIRILDRFSLATRCQALYKIIDKEIKYHDSPRHK